MLRLQTRHYHFIYTFASGRRLVGTVQGDNYTNQPKAIFNLRSLRAIYLDPARESILEFDDGFGQFKLCCAETIVSGSHSLSGSFFSISYRNNEACIYDAVTEQWITGHWQPEHWYLEELLETPSSPQPQPRLPQASEPVCWLNQAIA